MRRSVATAGSVVFFLVAPGTMAVLIPWLLTGWRVHDFGPLRYLGLIPLVAGALVLVKAFARFVVEGVGTPAPVAAPGRLVVGGLYRYVRNPMYVALLAVLLGQAILFGQLVLLLYAAALWAFAASYVRWREEPALVRRFGADYEAYRRAVPAWLPQLRPWTPEDRAS